VATPDNILAEQAMRLLTLFNEQQAQQGLRQVIPNAQLGTLAQQVVNADAIAERIQQPGVHEYVVSRETTDPAFDALYMLDADPNPILAPNLQMGVGVQTDSGGNWYFCVMTE